MVHFDEVHFDGWIAFVGTAALIAAFVVAALGFEATGLLIDANLAP
jgi:hypothetical protein